MVSLERVHPILCGLVAGLGGKISALCARAPGNRSPAGARPAARACVRRASGDNTTPMASDIRCDRGKSEMEYPKQNSRTIPSAALVTSAAIAFAGIMGAVAKPASAAKDDYMFCEAAGERSERVTYFSAIFLWDYSRSTRAKLDFHSYLRDAGRKPDFLRTYCWAGSLYGEATYEETKRKLEQRVRKRQRYPYTDWAIVHMDWQPGYSAPQPPGESDDPHGQEPGGDGCYFGECPDGVNPTPQSPNTPVPPQQTSRRTLICQTPDSRCEMSTGLPIGVPCGCLTLSGPIGGITVPSRP